MYKVLSPLSDQQRGKVKWNEKGLLVFHYYANAWLIRVQWPPALVAHVQGRVVTRWRSHFHAAPENSVWFTNTLVTLSRTGWGKKKPAGTNASNVFFTEKRKYLLHWRWQIKTIRENNITQALSSESQELLLGVLFFPLNNENVDMNGWIKLNLF